MILADVWQKFCFKAVTHFQASKMVDISYRNFLSRYGNQEIDVELQKKYRAYSGKFAERPWSRPKICAFTALGKLMSIFPNIRGYKEFPEVLQKAIKASGALKGLLFEIDDSQTKPMPKLNSKIKPLSALEVLLLNPELYVQPEGYNQDVIQRNNKIFLDTVKTLVISGANVTDAVMDMIAEKICYYLADDFSIKKSEEGYKALIPIADFLLEKYGKPVVVKCGNENYDVTELLKKNSFRNAKANFKTLFSFVQFINEQAFVIEPK